MLTQFLLGYYDLQVELYARTLSDFSSSTISSSFVHGALAGSLRDRRRRCPVGASGTIQDQCCCPFNINAGCVPLQDLIGGTASQAGVRMLVQQ
jgi:hypothetical protein